MDSKSKIIHTIKASAANVADVLAVWGDQAYRGQAETMREVAPRDFTNQRYRWGKRGG